MDEIENLLDGFVQFMNQVREDSNSPKVKELGLDLASRYYRLKNQGIDCLSVFDREFSSDTELYMLVLSVFFFLFKEKRFLDKAEELLWKEDIDYFLASALRTCINYYHFGQEQYASDYAQNRITHGKLLAQLKKILPCEMTYIPYEKRYHKRIVLMTDAFLGKKHAPTKAVVEMYSILRYELGYDVMFVVAVENGKAIPLDLYWFNPCTNSFLKHLNGNFRREFDGVIVEGYQLLIDGDHLKEMEAVIRKIQDWKPECVWFAGGESFFGDVFSEMTTLMVSHFLRGYAVSEAPILISTVEDNSNDVKQMEQYIQRKGQKMIKLAFSPLVDCKEEFCQKSDLGLPADRFIIAIVGNRLNSEIDKDFIGLMEKIIQREPKSYFIFIGKCDIGFDGKTFCGRTKKLGFCEDLAAVLSCADLYLNPVRSGGGGSAMNALAVDVPVITLRKGDVAVYAGDAFIVDSVEEIPDLVKRYCNDGAFYQHQIEECRRQRDSFLQIDNVQVLRELLAHVPEWGREEKTDLGKEV